MRNMKWRAIFAIIRKDLKVVRQSVGVIMPLIAVPVVLLVLLPAGFGLLVGSVDLNAPGMSDFQQMLDLFPPELLAEFEPLETDNQRIFVYGIVYLFASLFLLLPLMVSTVVAADSFAGEKERKTLEALVYTPTSDRELYTAKVLGPWLTAVIVTLVSFGLYSVVVNVLGLQILGRMFFPNAMWIALALWVTPAAAGLGLGVMVLVSSRVNSFQSAYQLGGMIVLPVLLLVIAQVGGVLFLSLPLVLLIGAALWVVDGVLLWYGANSFKRAEIIARL